MAAASYRSTFRRGRILPTSSIFRQRETFLAPVPNPTIHRQHLGVTHLLQVVGCERGTKSAATIEDHGRVRIRYPILDIALDDSFAQMNRPRQVIGRVLTFFTNIDEQKFFFPVELSFDIINRNFANALLGIFDDLQETRGMLMSHGSTMCVHSRFTAARSLARGGSYIYF